MSENDTEASPQAHYIDCARCGAGITTDRPDGLWGEDDEITCAECQAVNVVHLEECYDDDDDSYDVYVGNWRCKHGKGGDETCDLCDADEAAAEASNVR